MKLTPRECQILNCIAEGCTNKEAAVRLKLSLKTVETHLMRIYLKLGVKNRVGAVLALLKDIGNCDNANF